MRSPLFILIAAFLATLLIAQEFGGVLPVRRTGDAVDLIHGMVSRSATLGPALASADRGDNAPLMAWLNAADSRDRQALALTLCDLALASAGLKPQDASPASDAAFYRYRHRFTAFVNIPTGDDELDRDLDNLLAYVLVAGTREPSAEDVALAKRILPRLEKQMTTAPSAAVWDTIGCVRFVGGDANSSRAAFDEAVRLGLQDLAKASAKNRPDLERAVPLYRARQTAAGQVDRLKVERRDTPVVPPRLPLAAEVATPEKP